MNQRLLAVTWAIVVLAIGLLVYVSWQRLHPHRSPDQKLLIEKAK